MRKRLRGAVPLLSLLLPLVAAAIAWRPILGVYFYWDDFGHLYDVATRGLPDLLTQLWGGHPIAVFNLVTLGLFTLFGPRAGPAFALMLLTHLVNVFLLHRATLRATDDPVLAGAAALGWGTCPILAGALGWYSVYGQVLLTTLVLLVVGQLVTVARSERVLSVRWAAAWALLLGVGAGCFGFGIAMALVFPLAVLVTIPARRRAPGSMLVLVLGAAAVAALYAVARLHYRPVLPIESKLLDPLALLGVIPQALTFFASLLLGAAATVLPGFFGPSPVDLGPGAVVGGVAVVALLIAGWVAGDAATRGIVLAGVLLTVTIYGAIVGGRTYTVEYLGTPFASAALWPRYHYLGPALLGIAAFAAIGALARPSPAAGAVAHGVMILAVLVRLVLLWADPPTVQLHGAVRAEAHALLREIRIVIARTPPGETARIRNRGFKAGGFPWEFPGSAALFLLHFPANVVDGRQVRFLVANRTWTEMQARGGRAAALAMLWPPPKTAAAP